MPGSYPRHREADVVLRDGSTARIRPVRGEDAVALRAFLGELSLQAVALRFFSGAVDLEKVTRWMIDLDYRTTFGLIATTGPHHAIAAHVSYVAIAPDRAEVGLEVADAAQGHGLGTILLGHLAEIAQENGIETLEGHVLPQNHRMIDMFRATGFPLTTRSEPGEIVFEFPTSLSGAARERFEQREQSAAVAAMRCFLRPRAVAVIGAGRTRGTIAGELFHNLLAANFAGPVYPVNPNAEVVQSVVAYPSIDAVPGPVDLAVITVPATSVADAARACGAAGVRALVVISSGFAEVGGDGPERQRELLEVCRETGMRLIGPNCMGIINTDPAVNLDATFVDAHPPHGRMGFLSQSGALGLAVIDHATQLGLGISSFVSVGNKADISGNDLIHYWETDEDTDLILLYLESFGNPRTFARIARRTGKRKPIIAVKSGRSNAGARATSSHTGAILAASDVTVDALFAQSGVIRTDTLGEMFDVATLLANQPPPRGDRIGILTNAGGPGIMCADTCEAAGLSVPMLSDEVRERLAAFLPPEASLQNPVDMIASATTEHYRRAISTIAAWDGIDALVVIFIPPLATRAEEVAAAIRDAVESLPRAIPILSVFMSSRGIPAPLRDARVRIPTYPFPEDAARALAHAVRYGMWRERSDGRIRTYDDLERDRGASIIASALADGGGWMPPDAAWDLLRSYRLPVVEQRVVRSARAAGSAAHELGSAVVLKAVGPHLTHKTEAGAVRMGLTGRAAVETAARDLRARLAEAGTTVDAFVVQRLASGGVEALVGVVSDPAFGPVIACGAGGTAVELLNDVAVRVSPITEEDATAMIRGLRTYPLFSGFRGATPADVPALEDILLRVGALVEDRPEIADLDLNPVIVHERGATIVDARIRLERQRPRAPLLARRAEPATPAL